MHSVTETKVGLIDAYLLLGAGREGLMTNQDYDLVVVGSGPAGQKGAINAAKLGKRVVVIERAGMVGGTSVHSGTVPSMTLRDAILYLTGFNERAFRSIQP